MRKILFFNTLHIALKTRSQYFTVKLIVTSVNINMGSRVLNMTIIAKIRLILQAYRLQRPNFSQQTEFYKIGMNSAGIVSGRYSCSNIILQTAYPTDTTILVDQLSEAGQN